MNIQKEIFAMLKEKGCEFRIRNGIVYVKTPDNKVWDFTEPQEYLGVPPFELGVK